MIVKSFKSFIDKGKITYMCHKLGIKKFKVRQDGKVDVGGNVCIYGKKLKQIPIKFGNVSGHFECQNNYLRNLENCPDFVGGDFECSGNYIETLEFLPKRINGGFFCKNNSYCSIIGELEKMVHKQVENMYFHILKLLSIDIQYWVYGLFQYSMVLFYLSCLQATSCFHSLVCST